MQMINESDSFEKIEQELNQVWKVLKKNERINQEELLEDQRIWLQQRDEEAKKFLLENNTTEVEAYKKVTEKRVNYLRNFLSAHKKQEATLNSHSNPQEQKITKLEKNDLLKHQTTIEEKNADVLAQESIAPTSTTNQEPMPDAEKSEKTPQNQSSIQLGMITGCILAFVPFSIAAQRWKLFWRALKNNFSTKGTHFNGTIKWTTLSIILFITGFLGTQAYIWLF